VPWERWVDEARISLERLESHCILFFVIGLSMGGTIALYLASERNLNGVVTLSTPISLRHWTSRLLPLARPFVKSVKKKRNPEIRWTPEMGYDRYPLGGAVEFFELMRTTRKRLKDVRCPAMILHARGDRTVPTWNADVIYREIGSEEKQRVILEKPSHTITRGDNQKEVEKAVLRFIQREIEKKIE
jgi:carboxylesterase